MPLKIDNESSVAQVPVPGSGKGNGVAAIPSPKNRTGRFLYIRLKPFSPPVSPDAASQRINPGYELVDGRWDAVTPDFPPDLILLWIAITFRICTTHGVGFASPPVTVLSASRELGTLEPATYLLGKLVSIRRMQSYFG